MVLRFDAELRRIQSSVSGELIKGENTEIQIATTEELSFLKKYKKLDTPLQTINWNFAREGR